MSGYPTQIRSYGYGKVLSTKTMARISRVSIKDYGKSNLEKRNLIVVRVASFAFRFESIEQMRAWVKYYAQKTRPSSRIAAKTLAADLGEDWRQLRGWDVERWFERLPMYLLEEPKRQKVLKALSKTLALVEAGKFKFSE
jgi:hypothetical protein